MIEDKERKKSLTLHIKKISVENRITVKSRCRRTNRNGIKFQLWLSLTHVFIQLICVLRFTSAMYISSVALDEFWFDTKLLKSVHLTFPTKDSGLILRSGAFQYWAPVIFLSPLKPWLWHFHFIFSFLNLHCTVVWIYYTYQTLQWKVFL